MTGHTWFLLVSGLVIIALGLHYLHVGKVARTVQHVTQVMADEGGEFTVSDLEVRTRRSIAFIYPALATLETDGTVSSRFRRGPFPRRRVYWLTVDPCAKGERG
jgi:hypothetical protein